MSHNKALDGLSREQLIELLEIYSKNWLAADGIWFQSVERRLGMDEAMYHDVEIWKKFTVVEALKLKKFLGLPEQAGIDGLAKALSLRFYANINDDEISIDGNTLIYRMVDCRVQTARKRKGMEFHPCKAVGMVEYGEFARAIDSRFTCECISCYPEITDETCCCSWKFTLQEEKHISLVGKLTEDYYIKEQGARIQPALITKELARRFFTYFWGRTDVFSKRSVGKTTGKAGYYTQCDNFWAEGICLKASRTKIRCSECKHRAWTKLQAKHIENHLAGKKPDGSDVIGVYPLFPDGTCRFLVFDFDNHDKGAEANDFANTDNNWFDEVNAMREICHINQIPVLIERSRSGKGAHIWIFFAAPVSASLARKFGFALLDKGAESVNLKTFRYYDRMLPAQDYLENENSVGNVIALPLQGQALKNGNSAFIDENWDAYPDQWGKLFSTKKFSKADLENYLKQWNYSIITEDETQNNRSEAGETKPWTLTNSFHKEDVEGQFKIILSNRIYIYAVNLKPRLQNQIRRLARILNPVFIKNQKIGFSNYANSKYIYLGEDEGRYISLPRGILETLLNRCQQAEISYVIEDERCLGNSIAIEFSGTMRENQEQAVSKLIQYDCGILSAATAFGKTVVCGNIIAQKKTSTLILLESSALIEQWIKSLETFLRINEELPEYETRTGRKKKRKSLIGIIQGSKDTSTGIIDIAMAGSLRKKGEYHPRLQEYGLVIVDECHHSASETIKEILLEVKAKYVYGVTATPLRGDGLEKINYMLLGPVRYRYTAKQKAKEQGINHLVIPRFTRTVSPHGRKQLHVNDAYEIIRDSEIRNKQIIDDVIDCINKGRTPVVLSRYKEHAEILYKNISTFADKVFLLTGAKSKKEQKELRLKMENVLPTESMVLVATGQLIGEGFDYPRLDTLIMATPIAWKGLVEQYAGRLNRDYEGKTDVIIYDYVDAHIPVFDRMYVKRLKAYKRIGYKLSSNTDTVKQEADSIYDIDTYLPVYEKDLMEAEKEIIISSPTLSRNKVVNMIRMLKDKQENGIRVTIVTWHPNVYMYGRESYRVALLEMLRGNGFHIELMEEDCKRYAVVDREIVWYGSINLLSKEDVEDNIMRVVSKEIADELLEITFRKESGVMEY